MTQDIGEIEQVVSTRQSRLLPRVLSYEIIRPLVESDMSVILNPPKQAARPEKPLETLRHAHHRLAECLAQGMGTSEAAIVTGYSPGYISNIRGNPAFEDLIAHYSEVRQQVFVDTLERMKQLGITVLEELQEQLTLAPEKWSRRELMEFAELLLVKGANAQRPQTAGGAGGGSGVNVSVSFVTATPKEIGTTIEGTVERGS